MFTTQLDDPAVLVRRMVLSPSQSKPFEAQRDITICMPFFEGLKADGKPLQKLMAQSVPTGTKVFENSSDKVGLSVFLSMSEPAVVLAFGSRIHGNAHAASDLDLLILTAKNPGREYTYGKLSAQFETPERMIQRAEDGDLFVKYLCDGAVAIYDPQGFLPKLKAAFKPLKSYSKTRRGTADIAWMLTSPLIFDLNPKVASRKIVWALRTTSMAEGHDPFIHPEQVAPEDRNIIEHCKIAKDRAMNHSAFLGVHEFYNRRGLRNPWQNTENLAEFRLYFANSNNPVGVRICDELGNISDKPKTKNHITNKPLP